MKRKFVALMVVIVLSLTSLQLVVLKRRRTSFLKHWAWMHLAAVRFPLPTPTVDSMGTEPPALSLHFRTMPSWNR